MPADGKTAKAPRLADLIGNTPLVPFDRLAAHVAPAVRLYAKAEWFNPGGSVKDRAALGMLRAAEKAGLTRDRVLLDATSGNTGIAIAMLAATKKREFFDTIALRDAVLRAGPFDKVSR